MSALRAIRRRRPAGRQQGMVLMAVLVALAILSLMVAHTSQQMSEQNRREREVELLFVGEQYRQAILSFWRDSPGGVRRWPTHLDELLEDRRYPAPRRHLRQLYRDPMAPQLPWRLITQGNAILGVHSQAPGAPFRQAGFSAAQAGFNDAGSYADWRFIVDLGVAPATAAGSGSKGLPVPQVKSPTLPTINAGKP